MCLTRHPRCLVWHLKGFKSGDEEKGWEVVRGEIRRSGLEGDCAVIVVRSDNCENGLSGPLLVFSCSRRQSFWLGGPDVSPFHGSRRSLHGE